MKKYIILNILFLVAVFAGCEKEWVKPNNLVDVNFYTSQFRNVGKFNVGINKFASFSDLSQGELTHKWTISEGSIFLEGPITSKDSIFDKFKVAGLETDKKTINVLFTKGGLQPVRLYDTFSDSVAYRSQIPFPAKKSGNVWVIDTTFMVDVYDTIVPSYKIIQDGNMVPASKDTIYVEAGGSLAFIDMTLIGRPNTRSWDIAGISGKDSVSTILFKKLGTYTGYFTASRTGQYIPGDWERVKIRSIVKVIPSSKPFVQSGTIMEQLNETIQIPFNGEFVPFLNQESYFDVKVNGVKFTVNSVSINVNDATILDLKLSNKIYRPDVITISYSGGQLKSTDTRTLVAFSNAPVVMHNVNLLNNQVYSFEDGGTWVPVWDNVGTFVFVKGIGGNTGTSVKVTRGAGLKNHVESSKTTFNLPKGDYTLTYRLYIESTPAGASISPYVLNSSWAYAKQFWLGFYEGNNYWEIKNYGVGKWITITTDFNVGSDTSNLYIMLGLNNDNMVVYFDDFWIVNKEFRP